MLRLLPPDAVSDKEITLGGRKIAYTATAGTLSLFDQSGERSAAVFYTAYVAKGADAARRPVTFVFNGGPGAASAYLNLGLAGPRIVDFGPDGRDGAAAKLVDNPGHLARLHRPRDDRSDRHRLEPAGEARRRQRSSAACAATPTCIAKVIALYVAKNSRGASPKYLLGESYGGFRAAKVARALQSDQGIVVTGIVMVSPLLEASFQWGGSQYALGAALHFPSLVATELERTKTFTPEAHGRGRALRADRLPDDARRPAADRRRGQGVLRADRAHDRACRRTSVAKIARLRAQRLSASICARSGRGQQLRRDLCASPDPYPESSRRGSDPMLDGFSRALSGAFVGYARDELGFKTDMTYMLLARDVTRWDWGDRPRRRRASSDDLRECWRSHPSFRLLVVARPHRPGDALRRQPLPARSAIAGIGAPDRVAAQALSRRPHVLFRRGTERRAFAADAKAFYQSGP